MINSQTKLLLYQLRTSNQDSYLQGIRFDQEQIAGPALSFLGAKAAFLFHLLMADGLSDHFVLSDAFSTLVHSKNVSKSSSSFLLKKSRGYFDLKRIQ